MTIQPTDYGDMVIHDVDNLGFALAKALGARRIKRGGVRYFLPPDKARQFAALHASGFWPMRRAGAWAFTRDPRPRALYDALRACKMPLDGEAAGSVSSPNIRSQPHAEDNA